MNSLYNVSLVELFNYFEPKEDDLRSLIKFGDSYYGWCGSQDLLTLS